MVNCFPTSRAWIEHHLAEEIQKPLYLDAVAGWSVYFGAKNLMAYAQLCLVAEEIGRYKARRLLMERMFMSEYCRHLHFTRLLVTRLIAPSSVVVVSAGILPLGTGAFAQPLIFGIFGNPSASATLDYQIDRNGKLSKNTTRVIVALRSAATPLIVFDASLLPFISVHEITKHPLSLSFPLA